MSNLALCRWCGKQGHLVDACPDRKPKLVTTSVTNEPVVDNIIDNEVKVVDNGTKYKLLSTVKEVLSTKKRMTDYERLKKWRASHREEYNEWMREYRRKG